MNRQWQETGGAWRTWNSPPLHVVVFLIVRRTSERVNRRRSGGQRAPRRAAWSETVLVADGQEIAAKVDCPGKPRKKTKERASYTSASVSPALLRRPPNKAFGHGGDVP